MLGNTLLIVNPTARSGQASLAASKAIPYIENYLRQESPHGTLTVYHTLSQNDALHFTKANAQRFHSVIALGGDGLVHEVVNGLMCLDKSLRPQLGVIPCGNGDDFARSLRISRKPHESKQQLLSSKPIPLDIPCVNTIWYDETLSFGLDAAIALQTMDLRKKTKRTGTALYLQCGFDQLKNHRTLYNVRITLDNNEPFEASLYLLAIQNGLYYGGGFKICPEASLNDGLLDICYVTPELGFFAASRLFLKAKDGKHTADPHITFARASKITLDFEDNLPAQVDGEVIEGSHFEIQVAPKALKVLMPLQ